MAQRKGVRLFYPIIETELGNILGFNSRGYVRGDGRHTLDKQIIHVCRIFESLKVKRMIAVAWKIEERDEKFTGTYRLGKKHKVTVPLIGSLDKDLTILNHRYTYIKSTALGSIHEQSRTRKGVFGSKK